MYREVRFWSVVWTLAGLLSQLRAVSLGLVLGSVAAIVVARGIAAHPHFPLRGDELEKRSEVLKNSVITGFTGALTVPFLLPATLLRFIVVGPQSDPGPQSNPSDNHRNRTHGRPDASDDA